MLRRLLSRRFLVFLTFAIGLTSLIYLLLSPSLYNRPGSEVKSRLTTNTKDDLVNGNSFLSVVKEGVSFCCQCLGVYYDVLMKTIFIYLLVTLYFLSLLFQELKEQKQQKPSVTFQGIKKGTMITVKKRQKIIVLNSSSTVSRF